MVITLTFMRGRAVYPGVESLMVSGRLMSMGGKVSRCNHTALLANAVGLESEYSWFAPVQMARTLTWKLEIVLAAANDHYSIPVSYTHLTLPTNREV